MRERERVRVQDKEQRTARGFTAGAHTVTSWPPWCGPGYADVRPVLPSSARFHVRRGGVNVRHGGK